MLGLQDPNRASGGRWRLDDLTYRFTLVAPGEACTGKRHWYTMSKQPRCVEVEVGGLTHRFTPIAQGEACTGKTTLVHYEQTATLGFKWAS